MEDDNKKEETEEVTKEEDKSTDKARPFSVLTLVIIVLVIVFGAGIYYFKFLNKTFEEAKQLNEPVVEKMEEKMEEDVMMETDEEVVIRGAVLERVELTEEEAEFSITQISESHAKGNISAKGETGGGYWLAVNTEEGWKVVYDGQANPDCDEIAAYEFSTELVPECIDEDGEVVTR